MGVLGALPLAAAMLGAVGACGQAPAPAVAAPAYDVVSIRVNHSGTDDSGIDCDLRICRTENVSLKSMIASAYGVREALVTGLPAWAEALRLDIQAKTLDADDAALKKMTDREREALFVPVLEDRFHLRVHTELKTLPDYELVVAKDGPKLKPAATQDGGTGSSMSSRGGHGGKTELTAKDVLMPTFAKFLDRELDRPVQDKTGLTRTYDFTLKWQSEAGLLAASASDDTGQSIFAAVQDQLGLKLKPSKGPVETLVVDHVEMVGEN